MGLNVSVGFVDKALWRSLEPGTPSPERRLDVCRTLTGAGLRCGVLMGPVVPFLSDSPAQLEAAVRRIAGPARARHPDRPAPAAGDRDWYLRWLSEHHPGAAPRYRAMYRRGAYAPKDYQAEITGRVRELARRYGVGATTPAEFTSWGPAGAWARFRVRMRPAGPAPPAVRLPRPGQSAGRTRTGPGPGGPAAAQLAVRPGA